MGLFDRFFKKKEENQNINRTVHKKEDEVTYSYTKGGKKQLDYMEINSSFDKFYDTTRLIIGPCYKTIQGKEIYNCLVSWYNDSDAQMVDHIGIERDSRTAYKNVLVQIDLDLLETNPEYCKRVMTDLLAQKRVLEYLERGMQDNPQRPCGNYIGGIRITEDNSISKFFDLEIGREVHYSKEMQNQRNKKKQQEEIRRQEELEEKKRQMQKLQDEIDGLSK